MKAQSINDFADRHGRSRRVIHAPGALESWDAVARKLPVPKAHLIEGQLIQLFSDWTDGVRLHGNWAEPEASLEGSTKFFAIKRIPIRAYFWYSQRHKDTIVISHYVKKTWLKLRQTDIDRIRKNWRNEIAGDNR